MTSFYGNDSITPVVEKYIPAAMAESQKPAATPNKYVLFLVIGGTAVVMLVGLFISTDGGKNWDGSSLFLSGFMLLMIFVLVIGAIQARIKKMVAATMKEYISNINDTIAATAKGQVNEDEAMLFNPSFQLDIYEENELPEHNYTLKKPPGETGNIFNLEPLRIFYFANFFSTDAMLNKSSGGWQRHGTLYYLGSPADIAYLYTFKALSIKKIIKKLLIPTSEKLEEAIANANEKPLPPKTKGLKTDDYYDGAYPANIFYCADAIWQEGVQLLFSKTDVALIDCSDYSKDRSGLSWEIGQIINHIATENFIVLINTATDLSTLGESFRAAWKQMRTDSPNNKENTCPVRFVFHQKPASYFETKPRLSKKFLEELYHKQTLANDKIMALLLTTARMPASDVKER